MSSKRINQLNSIYKVADGDLLAVDIVGLTETKKVTKKDFLQEYVIDAPTDSHTQDWYWARKNGQWYRIYPDDYISEAPVDGGIYVRINGKWAKIEGVSGDMLMSIYDTKLRNTDIFNFVLDAIEPMLRLSSDLFSNTTLYGQSIKKSASIEAPLNELLIYGSTFSEDGKKSILHPIDFSGVKNIETSIIGTSWLLDKKIILGSLKDSKNQYVAKTEEDLQVKEYTAYKIHVANRIKMNFYGKRAREEEIYQLIGSELTEGDLLLVSDNINFIKIEFMRYDDMGFLQLMDDITSLSHEVGIGYPTEIQKFTIDLDDALNGIPDMFQDSIDVNAGKAFYQSQETLLNYASNWEVAGADFLRNKTIVFTVEQITDSSNWTDDNKINCYSNVLDSKSFADIVNTDDPCIACYNNRFYIRTIVSEFTNNKDHPDNLLIADFKQFLQQNSIAIKTIHKRIGDVLTVDILRLPSPMSYDDKTLIISQGSLHNTYIPLFLEATFEGVVDNLVRKKGDTVTGELKVLGGIYTPTITSIDNDELPIDLHINKDTNKKVFVNNSEVLDKRHFIVGERTSEWTPEVETILEKESNSKAIANAEYIKNYYAPLDSPNLYGTPVAPKSNSTGTSQIANGEFIEQFYFNKEESSQKFVDSTNGEITNSLVIETTIDKDESNLKKVPNLDYLQQYYYNGDKIAKDFAPLDSPVFTGNPTVPKANGTLPQQIINIEWAEDNLLRSDGGTLDGVYYLPIISGRDIGLIAEESTIAIRDISLDLESDPTQDFHSKNKAIITNERGEVIASEITADELNSLDNIDYNIKEKIEDIISKGSWLTGEITAWPSNNIPLNTALCDGRELNRVTYNKLFSIIGTTFGDGDGSTTFNVPDLRLKTIAGATDSQTVGTNLGADTHIHGITLNGTALTVAQLPNHDHTVTLSGNTSSVGVSHSHGISLNSNTVSDNHTHTQKGSFASGNPSSNHTHGISITSNSGGTHNHRQNVRNASGYSGTDGMTSGSGFGNNYHYGDRTEDTGAHTHLISGTSGTVSAWHTHTTKISGETGTQSTDHTHSVVGSTAVTNPVHEHIISGTFVSTTTGASEKHTHEISNEAGSSWQPTQLMHWIIKL